MIDFQQVASSALPHLESLCMELLPGGKKSGKEYVCASSDGGKGRSFSVNTQTGAWADFSGTDKGGDAVSLVAACRRTNQAEAAKWLIERLRLNIAAPMPAKAPKPAAEWVCVAAPDNPPPLPQRVSRKPLVSAWPYYHADGKIAGYAVRGEDEFGKAVLPLTWCRNSATSKEEWRFQAMPEPRPLYRLPDLLSRTDCEILVVEGEKTAVAAALLFQHLVVTCWAGGCKALAKTDLTPLAGRTVVYWPDNDEAGRQAAKEFAERLRHARIVTLPEGLPDGWDLADEIPDWLDPVGLVDAALQNEPEPEQPPFQYLGFDNHKYYLLPTNGGQVLDFTAPELTEANLITVAPMSYWFDTYGETKETKGGEVTIIRWSRARCDIVEGCRKAGVFDPDRIRGVGCWLEGKTVVVHSGDKLSYGGRETVLTASTSYVYQRGRSLHEQADIDPLSDASAARLINLSKLAAWTHPMAHLYLAGWCYIAPICGALHWRPHVWLVGKPGVGKSWITDNVLGNCVGKFAIRFRGGSTGPGIRQAIGRNALPSVGDDIESDVGSSPAVQAIVAFARNCSSPGEAKVLKGTADQSGTAFSACSMFACNSVNSPVMEQADKTRWTLLELVKNTPERFDEMKRIAAETVLDPAWCAGLRVRARRDAAILADNARVFSRAIAAKIGDSRAGDQLGTLLAGAYGLAKSGVVSDATAKEWVAVQDWEGASVDPDETPEQACLIRLLDAKVRVETEPGCDRTVAECIDAMRGVGVTMADLCKEAIERNGIRWESGVLSVSVAHSFLSRVYSGTRWETGTWGQDLIRLPGPDGIRKTMVRIGGINRKCVKLHY